MLIRKIYIILLIAFVCIVVIDGCSYKGPDYARYYLSDDMVDYKYGIDMLVYDLNNNKKIVNRIYAAQELGKFSLNTKDGARELLLDRGVPGLISAYNNEKCYEVRPQIIMALSRIKPPDDIVIFLYLKSLDKGWENDYEVYTAIDALYEVEYDISYYVDKMIQNIQSGDRRRIIFGFKCLSHMRKYSYKAIGIIEKMEQENKLEGYDNEIRETINSIKEDIAINEKEYGDSIY